MAKTLIPNKGATINIKNKRAEHDYLLLDKYTAGIVLTGTEIKSIRQGKASLVDTYCYVINGEVWLKNMYVAQYKQGSYNKTVKSPGFSIIPVLIFIDEKGLAKVDIHIARGKREYDKRETLKEKEDRRAIDRQFKKDF